MNISVLYQDYHNKSGEQSNNINDFVAAGLLFIIKHYFLSWSSYFVLTLSCRDKPTCNFYDDMLQKMFVKWKEWPFQIVVVNNNNYKKIPGARQHNMILTDSYEAFLETEIHTYTAENNKNEYYFIFLQTLDHLAPGEMQKIFQYCWIHYLINCVVQVQNANGRVLIYTYFPFTEKHCGKVEIVLVNEYNGTSLMHKPLFPKKLKNLYGCKLNAAVWHTPPFIYLSKDANNVTYISGGFEGKFLLKISKKLNFSLNIIVPPNDSKRGVVLSNGTLTGAMKMLVNREVDITMGSYIQTLIRNQIATPTTNYIQSTVAVVTMGDAYLLTSIETILYPFGTYTWYLIICMFLIAVGVIKILRHKLLKKKFKQLAERDTIELLQLSLGMPGIFKPQSNFTRILTTTWIIFALILRTAYQALLFHQIRTDVRRNIPQSLEQLAEQKYSIVISKSGVNTLKDINILNSLNTIVVNATFETSPVEYLENLPLNQVRNTAAILPLIYAQHYVYNYRKFGIFQVLPINVFNMANCIYMSKHSFLTDEINTLLERNRAFNLMQRWVNVEVDLNCLHSDLIATERVFGLQQLKIVFVMLCFGYIMAIIVFIWELFYRKYQYCYNANKKTILNSNLKI